MKKRTLLLWILFIFTMVAYYSYQSIADSFIIPDYKYIRAIRMEKFVDRFKNDWFDRVLIIEFTVEGGYVISDLTSYDNVINLTIDPIGDIYYNPEKQKVTCKNIKRRIKNFRIDYILDHCENYPADTEVSVAHME